jgi:hypothetical protein
MESAAASMTQTLRTALALVEHAKAQALPKVERRVERHRRAQDQRKAPASWTGQPRPDQAAE